MSTYIYFFLNPIVRYVLALYIKYTLAHSVSIINVKGLLI